MQKEGWWEQATMKETDQKGRRVLRREPSYLSSVAQSPGWTAARFHWTMPRQARPMKCARFCPYQHWNSHSSLTDTVLRQIASNKQQQCSDIKFKLDLFCMAKKPSVVCHFQSVRPKKKNNLWSRHHVCYSGEELPAAMQWVRKLNDLQTLSA